MIILDSNQLIANEGLRTPVVTILAELAAATGHRLTIPQMVFDEYLAHYVRELDTLSDELVRVSRRLKELSATWRRGPTLHGIDVARDARYHEQVVMSIFDVLPLPRDAGEEALRREAYRRLPASGGKGARDAAVWLTALDHAPTDSTTYFVAKDRRAFGEGALHGELEAEATERGAHIVLVNEIDELLDLLATRDQLSADEGQALASHDVVREAAEAELFDPFSGFDHLLGVPCVACQRHGTT